MKAPCGNNERGIALLTVVFVLTLAAIVATSLVTTQVVAVSRTGQLLQQEQAGWYGAGVENWAAQLLRVDREDSEIDTLDEVWAFPVDYLPIEQGFVSGQLVDQHGLFNLNDLASADSELVAEQLAKLLGYVVDPQPDPDNPVDRQPERIEDVDIPGLVQVITDWVDEDIDPRIPSGAEDDYYLGLEIPYRTANRPMESISELRLVRGMTPELFEAIVPVVTALPAGTTVNVNTADPRVLAALVPDMTLTEARSLATSREEEPFESVNDFMQSDAMAGRAVDDTRFGVSSEFFMLQAQTTVGTTRVALYSLFHRNPAGDIQVMGRSRNNY